MKIKNFYALAFCCFCSLSLFGQKVDKTKPVYHGTIGSLEYVSSLASRPGDLQPLDLTVKEAKDKRSLAEIISLVEDPQKEDDYFVRNRNAKEQSRAASPPSIVFDSYTSGSQPTDPSLAVGPDHVFVVFNTGFCIYDKEGEILVQPTAPNPAIFPSGGCCDLTVSYDNAADRWVLSFLGGGAQIAVSDGPNPVTAGWFVYTIPQIDDYQKLSVWSDGYYMTDQTGSAEKVWALERAEMLAGNPAAQIISFDLPGLANFGFYSPQAFNVTNADLPAAGGAPIVFLQDDAYAGVANDHLKLWTVDVDWVTPGSSTISLPTEIPMTPFISIFDGGSFVNLTQPAGGTDIDALQAIIMNQAQFRRFDDHNSAVFNFVVDTEADAGELAGIRWVELRQDADNMPWSLHQEGTYTAPDGRHAWNASIAMDGSGNMGMGYTSMSGPTTPTTVRVSSYYTSRLAGDPLGTMSGVEEVIANGNANIPGTRYGDYSKIDVCPNDDATFWFITEYMNTQRRGVVGAFSVEAMYCASQSGNASEEFISNVELNTINNASGSATYSDFTAISTDLEEGETYDISITPTWTGTVYSEGYAVYIDYNNDLDFEDAGELVWSAAANMTSPNVGTFTVPMGTSLSSVRMRVSMKFNGIPDPCETFSFGEVEDYTINLLPFDPCDVYDFNDGESGWGIWNDGGADAGLANKPDYANSGTYAFLIKDNTGQSHITTDVLDFSGVADATISFNYIAIGFNNSFTQDFWLQMSTDGGATYTTLREYDYKVHFDNEVREFVSVFLEEAFTSTTRFRFRCDATGNNDKVYIDDIEIIACTASSATCDDGYLNQGEEQVDCGGPNCEECEGCYDIGFNDFEGNFGVWNDGGADCRRNKADAPFASSGLFCVRLQDDSPTSNITTDDMDLTPYSVVYFDFSYYPTNFSGTEGFYAEYSTDGGATFTVVNHYVVGTDFDNGTLYSVINDVFGPFTSTTQFRLRCDGSTNGDRLYLDDIYLSGCYDGGSSARENIVVETRIDHGEKLKSFTKEFDTKINLYPNPAYSELTVDITDGAFEEILVFSTTGQLMHKVQQGTNKFNIDLTDYLPGLYFIRFVSEDGLAVTKRFVKE